MKIRTLLVLALTVALVSSNANAALLVRELFDGLSGPLDGAGDSATSVGFSASPWRANPASPTALSSLMLANDFNVEVPLTNVMPWQLGAGDANRGGIWWYNSYNWDIGSWAMRPLAPGSELNLGADGVYYLTFNIHYRDDDTSGLVSRPQTAPVTPSFPLG